MKVLFTFGGMPHYVVAQLNKLQDSGVDVVALIPEGKQATIGEGVRQEFEGIRFKLIFDKEIKTWYKKSFFQNFKKKIEEENPDIVVFIWPYILSVVLLAGMYKYLRAKNNKIVLKEIPFDVPPFMKFVSYYKQNPLYNESMQKQSGGILFYLNALIVSFVRKCYYKRIDASVNYTSAAYSIQTGYGLSPDRIFVTLNSTDADLLASYCAEIQNEMSKLLPPSSKRIIHIGRLVKWKKVDVLIKAFAIVSEQIIDSELIIIGSGPHLAELKKLTSNLGLDYRIKFIGAINDDKTLMRYLLESTVYVLAGMGGLSINDAMVAGKPVICSRCDGTEKFLVRDGFNGFFFQEDNVTDLADKINTLFRNPELVKKMGENSIQIIEKEVNMNVVSSKYLEAFQFVLHSTKNN